MDKSLAYARHYPAINWTESYSEYLEDTAEYYTQHGGENFTEYRNRLSNLLIEENKLMEIVKLIGSDVLPDDQKLIEIARVIRVGILQQNAYHKDDTYVPLKKQYLMTQTVLHLYDCSRRALSKNITMSEILATGLYEKSNQDEIRHSK